MWNGSDILEIITKYNIHVGTSFYVYDLKQISEKIMQVQNIFTEWKILYSLKANPNTQILNEILRYNLGIDAASCKEVLIARQYGCSPENIYYSAPGKTIDDLVQCWSQCIIIADSINEVKRINKIAKGKKESIKIGVRVNIPNAEIIGNAFEVMGGVPSKFGISPGDIKYLKEICREGYIKIIGIHIYFGSQILDENIIINNMIKIATFALELTQVFHLEFINFGGGFGIPSRETEPPLLLENIVNNYEFQKKIALIFERDIHCNLELGRYLVAESGIFCASVEDIKYSFGRKYIILSSGINGFFRPVFTKEFHKIAKCKKTGEVMETVNIVGNLCTPIDQFYEDYQIEKLEIGDWLWFQNAGAYGFSMSMLNFISKDRPLEFIV